MQVEERGCEAEKERKPVKCALSNLLLVWENGALSQWEILGSTVEHPLQSDFTQDAREL